MYTIGSYSKKSTFCLDHIPFWAQSKEGTLQKEHIPKRVYSIFNTFQKANIPFWSHSLFITFQNEQIHKKNTFQKDHIPKIAHFKKDTFHLGHISKRAHSILNTFQKGHFKNYIHSKILDIPRPYTQATPSACLVQLAWQIYKLVCFKGCCKTGCMLWTWVWLLKHWIIPSVLPLRITTKTTTTHHLMLHWLNLIGCVFTDKLP